jgi:hypothetical protein
MELQRVYRPAVADLHHFDEEQYPDPDESEKLEDPHYSEKLNPDPQLSDADPQPCNATHRSDLLLTSAQKKGSPIPQRKGRAASKSPN